MSRINTNVSSLVAQTALARSNASLQTALNRLSTGLRINVGKDDPAGLIASENLRRDITAINRAIGNTERANQLIATADSALGQVSSLLNDIRGLVTEAANSGALSDEQIAANQLQVDSSLEAIDRIARVTTFQGRRILDGSLDFITNGSTNFDKISNLQVQQASLGTTGQVSVDVNISVAATQAQVDITNVPAATAGVNAYDDLTITNSIQQANGGFSLATTQLEASGTFTLSTAGSDILVTALAGGAAEGASGNNIDIQLVDNGGGATTASYAAGTITVNFDLGAGTVDADAIAAAIQGINGGADFTSSATSGGATVLLAGDIAAPYNNVTSRGRDAGAGDTISVAAVAGGAADGAAGNGLTVDLVDSGIGGPTSVAFAGSTITVNIDFSASDTSDVATAIQAFNGGADFTASSSGTTILGTGDDQTYNTNSAGGRDAGSTTIRVLSDTAGTSANGVQVSLTEDGTITNNTASASFDSGTNTIEVLVRGTVTRAAIAAAIDGVSGYSASVISSSGDQNYVETDDTPPANATLANGVDSGGGLTQDVVFELSGLKGSEVFSFTAGASISTLPSAINAISDATGVAASVSGTTLQLTSQDYGSKAFVDIKVVSEASGGTIKAAVNQGTRDTGTDVVADVKGLRATGEGNALSVNSATLDLSLAVQAGFTGTINFDITGGGALFQLGPDVIGNQQARLGINSVNTATLGGTAGRLYELRTGEGSALATDPNSAYQIVDQVITNVTELRGRLGAFQKTTLDSNTVALNDTLTNLTAAESSIRDADFAKESASLTRAQILVQSGTAVLQIANQNPQNVLSLLRG